MSTSSRDLTAEEFAARLAALGDPAARADLERMEAAAFRKRMAARISGKRVPPPEPLPPYPGDAPELGISMLAMGDPHAHPDHPNHRFEWAGRMAAEREFDVIWCAGDWADMPSLSSYDKGNRSYEGSRYRRDLEASIDALERFEHALKKNSRRGYKPRKIITLGNHEARIDRVVEHEPMLYGTLSTEDLLFREFGWEVYPFLEHVHVEGVVLTHYFQSGVMGRAIGGENPASMLLKKGFSSALQGHSHVLDYCDRYSNDGRTIQTMHVGCFFDYDFAWASRQVNRIYARGLLEIRNLKGGSYDPCWWSMDRIQSEYGA